MNMLLWGPDISAPAYAPVLSALAELGFDGIEVPIFNLDVAVYAELGRRLRDLGMSALALTARGPDANPISADADVRAAALSQSLLALDCAAALGAEIVCGPVHQTPCAFTGKPPTERERQWAVELLRAMADAADRHGITLAIEALNHFEHHLVNTAAETAELCREVDRPRCRMIYDTFHAHIEERDVAAAITGCADMIAYVHVSENDRAELGRGQVQWDATLRALRATGYDGWLTIEAFARNDPVMASELKTWRVRLDSSELELARHGLAFVRERWDAAGG
jgi:D-psicose/D-tagatose/L-ribulose 3-epimerase